MGAEKIPVTTDATAEHLRIALCNYTARTVPELDIDAYAQRVYQANQASGL